MELRQLQYFLLVSQELSFVKASKKAYISQQALSKSISSLEKELGIPLFDRHPHGVALTTYGQVLAKKAYRITASVNQVYSDLHNMKANLCNTIQLAITTGVEDCFPINDLLRFQEIHPQYRISTVANNDVKIEEWLFSEKIELGLLGAKGDESKFDFIPLRQSGTLLAVHKDNPLSRKDSVRIEDLKNERFLFSSGDYYVNNRLLAICNLSGFTPEIMHQTENIIYISQLVANNQGIFLSPDHSAKFFEHPDVRLIPMENDPLIFCVCLVIKKNKPLSEGAGLFKKYVLEINRN
jgi:DNA-binding transcriptional LysR family regulator